jgi:hypothetical protein
MLNRFCLGVMSISIIGIGAVGILKGGFYSTLHGRYIYFGPSPQVAGVAILVPGIIAGYMAPRRR